MLRGGLMGLGWSKAASRCECIGVEDGDPAVSGEEDAVPPEFGQRPMHGQLCHTDQRGEFMLGYAHPDLDALLGAFTVVLHEFVEEAGEPDVG
jgi:hypothetical protein